MFFVNQESRANASNRGLFDDSEYALVAGYFDQRPELTPTPLQRLPGLAALLGIGDLLVKDESSRFGLSAFKILGVQFAVARLLADRPRGRALTLACATAGNHGRAVARAARNLGLEAQIFVPSYTLQEKVDAIAAEGATVTVYPGSYDEAVKEVVRRADASGWQIVSDTGWAGYDAIPHAIMLGYTRMLDEASRQWAPSPPPDVVLVQAGVGGLACAILSWFLHRYGPSRPFIIAAEPTRAACLQVSARAGHPVTLAGSLDTIMAGLRCGEVSTTAWPTIAAGMDGYAAVEDEASRSAMDVLARPIDRDPAITAGPSGACGLAALTCLLRDPEAGPLREASGLGPHSRVLLVVTEGR